MFSAVRIDEPLEKVVDDWDFLNDRIVSKFAAFRGVGDNIFGIRKRGISEEGLADRRKGVLSRFWELGPDGVIECHYHPSTIHVTLSGTPHHVEHNFGYWHVNDMDELYLPIPDGPSTGEGYFVICMGNPRPGETDGFAWYCEQCCTLLFQRDFDTGTEGLAHFWLAERAVVKEYNEDRKLRQCPECGHENPLGYCWNPSKDTPEEADARRRW